ncbi:hypothetical protein NDN08_008268 [Rhodosorus marinus]|uniref:Complex 1 LYR protein domain-containing protein n=1 Tax=Rhodosorus marinus TaxID=101924 RepID=A0AAV8V094_9RHOD|nr:hypothetical protein NDN08_008268 [Rhodosorus marinus]
METKTRILKLYRELLRDIGKLPKETRGYYFQYTRQQFNSHVDEVETDRIDEMINRSREYSQWVQTKYSRPMDSSSSRFTPWAR